jgi:beta-lactam-binding protein with PASTA domain
MPGLISSETPGPGSSVAKGTSISLRISKRST